MVQGLGRTRMWRAPRPSSLLTACIFTPQTSALTQGLERIPDQLGYLVLSEGAVLAVRSGKGREGPRAQLAVWLPLSPVLGL